MLTVDRAVVISLETRPDRRAKFFSGLPERWPLPHVQLVNAVNGQHAQRPQTFDGSSGAFGCAVSHVGVLRQAIADGLESVLVLEDDAFFVEDFADRWSEFASWMPPTWDMVMLGGQHFLGGTEPVNDEVVRCRNTKRTHAYVVHRRALHSLQALWVTGNKDIDKLLPRWERDHDVYAPRRWMVHQASGYSDIREREVPGTI